MSSKQLAVTAKALIKVLEKKGFLFSRQSGSHAIYRNNEGTKVTIPIHGKKSIGKGLLSQILKDAGLKNENLQ